ncbi:hypothetical protein [Bradyrhizobium sp.]|uniref:hypothetical protein n=1 Tax=Bradyrhizobium sp. TaxID=376 RepID=UPI0025C6B76E|nr:hypothetical protein [Bradyrhizobium sp.]MBV8919725.1 hypothetical protein [Bradyrhizobium sp.]
MRFLFAIVVLLALGKAEAAKAQSPTETDVRAQKALAEHPDSGVLIVDAGMRNAKGEPMDCLVTTLTLVNAETSKVVTIETAIRKWIGDDDNGAAVLMPSGVYAIATFGCDVGRLDSRYQGNFAKVTVRAGEVLSAGTLVIDYNTDGALIRPTFSGSAHVEDYSPKTLASLKKRYPATLARAKRSPLIVLSAMERKNGVLPSKPTEPH